MTGSQYEARLTKRKIRKMVIIAIAIFLILVVPSLIDAYRNFRIKNIAPKLNNLILTALSDHETVFDPKYKCFVQENAKLGTTPDWTKLKFCIYEIHGNAKLGKDKQQNREVLKNAINTITNYNYDSDGEPNNLPKGINLGYNKSIEEITLEDHSYKYRFSKNELGINDFYDLGFGLNPECQVYLYFNRLDEKENNQEIINYTVDCRFNKLAFW